MAARQTRLSDRIENLTHKNSPPIPNYPRYKNGVTMQRWRAAAESRFEEYNQKTEKKLSRWRNKFVVHPALSAVSIVSGAAVYGDDGAGGPPQRRPAPAGLPAPSKYFCINHICIPALNCLITRTPRSAPAGSTALLCRTVRRNSQID